MPVRVNGIPKKRYGIGVAKMVNIDVEFAVIQVNLSQVRGF
jgi:hypothetical protein